MCIIDLLWQVHIQSDVLKSRRDNTGQMLCTARLPEHSTLFSESLLNVELLWTMLRYCSNVLACGLIYISNMRVLLFPTNTRQMALRRNIAYLGYALVIILGTVPGARAEVGEVAPGLFLHFATYASIAMLLFTGTNATAIGRVLYSVLIVAVMGAVDEFIQSFLPYRHGAISDWYVDVLAAMTMALILFRLFTRSQKKLLRERYATSDQRN